MGNDFNMGAEVGANESDAGVRCGWMNFEMNWPTGVESDPSVANGPCHSSLIQFKSPYPPDQEHDLSQVFLRSSAYQPKGLAASKTILVSACSS
jgi:hypothetical protein